jgi:hypothetical protein
MLGQPPGDVFPWLFEQDRVPRWTSGLEAYEVRGALGPGARVRQVLEVSGQKIDVDMEVTRYEPPSAAETRFRVSGLDVVTSYALRAVDAGSELTQTLEGRAASVKARLLVPVVQPRLERKLTADLERLREVLAAA